MRHHIFRWLSFGQTATNPLERIKMLSQTGEHSAATSSSSPKNSIVALYRDILRKEGIVGLWAGNGANLLRVFPAKAVVFSANDVYRQAIGTSLDYVYQTKPPPPQSQSQQQQPPKLSPGWSFLAGGLAGMTATLVTYPLDFARGRISGKLARGTENKKVYKGIVSTILVTVKEEGVLAVYKGVTPTLLGAMPYEGIKFGTVGVLESTFPKSHDNDSTTLSPAVRKMLFGGLGGVMAGLITYPNDTIRRLLQLQGSRGTTAVYTGYWDCLQQTVRTGGVARLYAGLGANLLRMAPNAAVQFGSYEFLKQHTADWV